MVKILPKRNCRPRVHFTFTLLTQVTSAIISAPGHEPCPPFQNMPESLIALNPSACRRGQDRHAAVLGRSQPPTASGDLHVQQKKGRSR